MRKETDRQADRCGEKWIIKCRPFFLALSLPSPLRFFFVLPHSMSNGNVAEPIDQFCSEEQMGMGMPWPTSLESRKEEEEKVFAISREYFQHICFFFAETIFDSVPTEQDSRSHTHTHLEIKEF